MSLLLEALHRSESERKQQESQHGLTSLQQPLSGATYQHGTAQFAHPAGSTVINTGNQTPWFLVVLCFNALLFVVGGLFWIQLENQKNNNDMLFSRI